MNDELYKYLTGRLEWLQSLDTQAFTESKGNINGQIALITYLLDKFGNKSEKST